MLKEALFIFFIIPIIIKGQGIVNGDTIASGIVYNNLKDTILTVIPKGTNTIDFDLDNDNVDDIRFSISQNYSPGFTWEVQQVYSLNNLEFVTLITPSGHLDSIALYSNINNSLNWYNSNPVNLFEYNYSAGNTVITGVYMKLNNYLGFRKITPMDTIYGWILLDAGLYSGTKIRSWAYTSKLLGVQDAIVKEENIKIFPNPTFNELIINCQTYRIIELKIINSIGEVVVSQKTEDSIGKLSVNVNGLRLGIYVIELSTENELVTKKFIKQ